MQLYLPTKLYSEPQCVSRHAKELASYGKKAMLVTGRHASAQNGSLQAVTAALEQEKTEYIIYDEIEENPSVETVMKAAELGLREKVDFVIGIGGGSPLDASKAIALMIANPDQTEAVLYQAEPLDYLPVVCVPTTCGTGSEVTPYAILTLHKQRTKKSISHRIYPKLALLDAAYLETMPYDGLVSTAVDALAHLIESHLNANTTEFSRIYSREGLYLWAQSKDALRKKELQQEDYRRLLHASAVAGMAITHTGTSLPHGLSYPVTYELKLPHGRAVGMFLGGYVETYRDKEAVREVLTMLGFTAAEELREYLRGLLGTSGVEKELLHTSAEQLLANPAKLKNYPFPITKEELIAMAD